MAAHNRDRIDEALDGDSIEVIHDTEGEEEEEDIYTSQTKTTPKESASELFEIVDHTSASPWERFITSIEDLLHVWQLNFDPDKPNRKRRKLAGPGYAFEVLMFDSNPYLLTYFYNSSKATSPEDEVYGDNDEIPPILLQQLGNAPSDFARDGHGIPIQRWFGPFDFLVLAPANDDVITPSVSKLLISSLAIALNNTKCTLPAFVPQGEQWRNQYTGFSVCDGVEVRYATTVLNYVPRSYGHLSGIADLLASKLSQGALLSRSALQIRCAVRFSYNLSNWFHEDWRSNAILPSTNDVFFEWGPRTDPLEFLQIGATWPDFSEDSISDNAVYSDLNARDAPVWVLGRQLRPRVSHPLSDVIDSLVSTLAAAMDQPDEEDEEEENTTKMAQGETPLVWDAMEHGHVSRDEFVGHSKSLRSAISGNTRLMGVFENTLGNVMGRNASQGLPTFDDLEMIRLILFAPRDPVVLHEFGDHSKLKLMKSCPRDSLGWHIAMQVTLDVSDTSLKRLAILWNMIAREIRLHWETSVPLVRVNEGPSDLRTSLLHQKLQLLNYCIRRKRQAAGSTGRSSPVVRSDSPKPRLNRRISRVHSDDLTSPLRTGEDEDTFFDTIEEIPGLTAGMVETTNDLFMSSTKAHRKPLQREGVHHSLQGIYLTNHPHELVHAPITQELGFMTEDMLEEQQQAFEQMGSNAEATLGRAKLQATSLLSDMQAFKAANPDAVLEDFVRWHSPNDWVNDDNGNEPDASHRGKGLGKGKLSSRMTEPNNLWQSTWQNALAVPAAKQKPVFNYEQEALKIIHFVENLSVAELLQLIAPTAIVIAHDSLAVQQPLFTLSPIKEHWEALQKRAQEINWSDLANCFSDLRLLVKDLRRAELLISTALSLQHKLGGAHKKLVSRLLNDRETMLLTVAERTAVHDLFIERGGPGIFGEAPLREFIVRALSPQPSPASRPLIHRLYASLTEQELRLTEAFAMDTVFL